MSLKFMGYYGGITAAFYILTWTKLVYGLDDNDDVGRLKISQLIELSDDAYYNSFDLSSVIKFNMTGYNNYVLTEPKPYHLFILLTANSGVCRVCPNLERAFDRASLSYYAADGQHKMVADGDEPVFFGIIDAYTNSELQRIHELKSVPILAHLSQKAKQSTRKKKSGALALKDSFTITKYDHSAADLLEWMNKKTGQDVKVFKTRNEKLSGALKMAFGAVLLVAAGIFGIYSARTWPITCAIVALCIEFVSMSGIFFNILQGMMLHGRDSKGNPEWIMSGMRGQYLGEGLAASLMMVASGVCMLMAVRLPNIKYLQGSKKSTTLQIILVIISLGCMWAVFEMYSTKTGWAMSSTFYPPDTYKKGWITTDQGNTF